MSRFSKRLAALLCLNVLSCVTMWAQTNLSSENWPTYVSPNYSGPNAFPVPDILKRTAEKLEVELSSSGALGHIASEMDKTATLEFALKVPLWTERVNFSLWGQLGEWYSDTPQTREARKAVADLPLEGGQFGDIYFSVDAKVLRESEKCPAIIVRAACKLASGSNAPAKRYYDSPGYFIDASVVKSFKVGAKQSLDLALSTGFLCWQVKTDRQNDAVMYGLSIGYLYDSIARVSADYGGYTGWRHDGDSPMTLKIKADFLPNYMFTPFVEYEHGFMDWPFDLFRIGVRYSVGILKTQS